MTLFTKIHQKSFKKSSHPGNPEAGARTCTRSSIGFLRASTPYAAAAAAWARPAPLSAGFRSGHRLATSAGTTQCSGATGAAELHTRLRLALFFLQRYGSDQSKPEAPARGAGLRPATSLPAGRLLKAGGVADAAPERRGGRLAAVRVGSRGSRAAERGVLGVWRWGAGSAGGVVVVVGSDRQEQNPWNIQQNPISGLYADKLKYAEILTWVK